MLDTLNLKPVAPNHSKRYCRTAVSSCCIAFSLQVVSLLHELLVSTSGQWIPLLYRAFTLDLPFLNIHWHAVAFDTPHAQGIHSTHALSIHYVAFCCEREILHQISDLRLESRNI